MIIRDGAAAASRIFLVGGVKDPADLVTADLLGLEPKRGRGRPRKPDALTPAQRAKAYRDRKYDRARNKKAWAAHERKMDKLQPIAAQVEAPAFKCHQCGQTAVWGPRVACEICWPFPNGSP